MEIKGDGGIVGIFVLTRVCSQCVMFVCVCVCVCVMFVLSGGCYDECDEGKLVREPLHGTNNASKR